MIYELMQKFGMKVKALSIITDGIKKGKSNIAVAVFSNIPGLSLNSPEEIRTICFPGAEPYKTWDFHNFPQKEYERKTKDRSFDEQLNAFSYELQECDIVFSYFPDFIERFIDKDLITSEWNILDIVNHILVSEEDLVLDPSADKKQITEKFIILFNSLKVSDYQRSWRDMSHALDKHLTGVLDDCPKWKKKHLTLRELVKMI